MLNLSELRDFQKVIVENIKIQLMKTGQVSQSLIGCTHAGLVPTHFPGYNSEILQSGSESPSSKAIAIMDLNIGEDNLLTILTNLAENEKQKQAIVALLEIRKKFSEQNNENLDFAQIKKEVVDAICEIRGIDRKDILALGMRWFLEQIHAYAAYFVSEVWFGTCKANEENIGSVPRNQEGFIVQLETGEHIVALVTPIIRGSDDKITGFGEQMELSTESGDISLHGRFTNLLKSLSSKNQTVH